MLDHLPESDRPAIRARLRRAWRETDYDRALEQLKRLATELEHTHPGAAGSLREGMQETLTVIKLGIKGKLRRTLESTNPCESMIDTVRRTQRNVKRWRDGEMGLRWTAAGMLEAEKQFRKVIGYTQPPSRIVESILRRDCSPRCVSHRRDGASLGSTIARRSASGRPALPCSHVRIRSV